MALLIHIDRLRGLADDTIPTVPDFNYPVLGWDLPSANTVVNLSRYCINFSTILCLLDNMFIYPFLVSN